MKKLILLCVLLTSCGRHDYKEIPVPDVTSMDTQIEKVSTGEQIKPKDRFTLVRVQKLYDKLSYGYHRGIYILKDHETGKEYVGISGIGISELGSHTTGKIIATDER